MSMAREKKIQFWVNDLEYKQLKDYAESKQIAVGELLRDYIKSLPKVKE